MDTIANSKSQRIFAGLIALIAWLGLATQLAASNDLLGSMTLTIWRMLGYFTVLTNLLVAILFTGIALGARQFERAPVISGVALAILMVGIIYGMLLRGLVELSGGAVLADLLLHSVTPVLVLGYWIVFVAKGQLRWRHPLLWATYPVVYFLYALVRGSIESRYPYPFLDVIRIGWGGTATNGFLILLGFVIAGLALVWVDGRLGARRTQP